MEKATAEADVSNSHLHLVPKHGTDVNGHAYTRQAKPEGAAAGSLGNSDLTPSAPAPSAADPAEEQRLAEAQDPFESHEDRVKGLGRDLIAYMNIPGDDDAEPARYMAGLGWQMPEDDERDLEEVIEEASRAVQASDGLPFGDEQWAKVAEHAVDEGAFQNLAAVRERIQDIGLREDFVQSYADAQVNHGFLVGPEGEVVQTLHHSDWSSPRGVLTSFDATSAAALRDDAEDFADANAADLVAYTHLLTERGLVSSEQEAFARAANDFALTRNGHGAGFWDRDMGELGERLSTAARAYGGQQVLASDPDGGQLTITS